MPYAFSGIPLIPLANSCYPSFNASGMKKFKVGMIGYGWAAGAHIDAINKTTLAEVVAVYASGQLNALEVSGKHGGKIDCYSDLATMLKEAPIDAVSICSYPYEHASHIIAAAKAGKHIIVEKPLAL